MDVSYTSNTTINNTGGPTAVVLTPVNTNCGGSMVHLQLAQ
jgi:hypothetical protein